MDGDDRGALYREINELKAKVTALESTITNLRSDKDEQGSEKDDLRDEVRDLQTQVDEMEESVDSACAARDEAREAARIEKTKNLAMLRRLEFCLHGLCPLCLGVLEHKVGCDMKLAIFCGDHELVRVAYES